MDVYENLASRYRPQHLDQLVGQDHIVAQLRGMFQSGRVTRTFLISGPYGCGKTTIARIIARYANCLEFKAEMGEPCGECFSCKRDSASHPDIHEINAANFRGIDAVREIINQSKYKPQTNKRVYILDEAHQLTGAALQSFLKTLEEPSKHTIFMLVTTNPEMLPNTISSRCTQLTVHSVAPQDCAGFLKRVADKEGFDGLSVDGFMKLAGIVRGHPRNALLALDAIINFMAAKQDEIPNIEDMLVEIVEKVVALPPTALVTKYLIGIYSGKFTGPLRVAKAVQNVDHFMQSILEYHTQALFHAIDPGKLADRVVYRSFFENLVDKQAGCSPKLMNDLMQLFVHTASEVKQHLVAERYLLYGATVQASTMVATDMGLSTVLGGGKAA